MLLCTLFLYLNVELQYDSLSTKVLSVYLLQFKRKEKVIILSGNGY